MKSAANFRIVLVTAPDIKVARGLARAALAEGLAACANLLPITESHYWWQGKIESSAEVLIMFKTEKSRLSALEQLIVSQHPYDTMEFLVLAVAAGNGKYLDWLRASCRKDFC